MKLDSEVADRKYERLLGDTGIPREKFDSYNVSREIIGVESIGRMIGDVGESFVLTMRGKKLIGASDHRYRYRETAELVAKARNLAMTPPRERGVYASREKAAAAWSKLTGMYVGASGGHIYRADENGQPTGPALSHGWHAIGAKLDREGKIVAAGFGRFRIAADQYPTDESRSYRTKTGRVLTDADIEALADEAERGYDVEHLAKRGTS